jgi:UPF0755 protein
MRRLLLTGIATLAVAGLAWYSTLVVYEAPGPLDHPADIVVPRGGVAPVGVALKTRGVIRSVWEFRAAALATSWQGPIHAGELAFKAHARLADVLAILRFGHPIQHKVTLAEGLTSAQVTEVLARNDDLTGDIILPAEGSVLPQTYSFELGATREALLGRAESAMRAALGDAWLRRAPGLPISSPREALILASIVERETGLAAERPMVARVFLNRLVKGMKLQADPTAAYGAAGGLGRLDRRLDRDDLARQDLYNTYVVPGMPAGPICNPGLAAIEAVLHPAASSALYFVADGTGGHVFAERLGEHDKNVARLRALPH